MKITDVSVQVRNVNEAAGFYEGVLGLGIEREPGAVAVRIGSTRLELVEKAGSDGCHHFAITIPANKFARAKAWLQERVVLLGTAESDEFECSPEWNARSLYFAGPDNSVLELIVRRDLDNARPGAFASEDLLCISEVGVAVSAVPAAAALLSDDAALASYGPPPGETFAPVGDADGMLILVTAGRTWFPTIDRVAVDSPVLIDATGARPGTYRLGAGSTLRLS